MVGTAHEKCFPVEPHCLRLCPPYGSGMRRIEFRMADAHIRINGQDEILSAATLAALLEEKAVDTEQRGIAAALNGAVGPRAAWKETPLRAGDTIEMVRARQGG